jgi:hypothetical protein
MWVPQLGRVCAGQGERRGRAMRDGMAARGAGELLGLRGIEAIVAHMPACPGPSAKLS